MLPAKGSADALSDSDSDWEWEYSATERETYYVTLDLSSSLPSAPKRGKAAHAAKRPSAGAPTPLLPSAGDGIIDPALLEASASANASSDARIQILDLHSSNPIVSYQGQIYSCTWSSTIGTDLLISRPDLCSVPPPLLRQAGFDLLAATRIKLVGQAVQLAPRAEGRGNTESSAPLEKQVYVPIPGANSRTKQTQARFLERLIAAKGARGETDAVIISSGSRSGPTRLAMPANSPPASENGDADLPSANHLASPSRVQGKQAERGGRPRPRGRIRLHRVTNKVGGLFRDYRPALGHAAGADISSHPPDSTPSSWPQHYDAGDEKHQDGDDIEMAEDD